MPTACSLARCLLVFGVGDEQGCLVDDCQQGVGQRVHGLRGQSSVGHGELKEGADDAESVALFEFAPVLPALWLVRR